MSPDFGLARESDYVILTFVRMWGLTNSAREFETELDIREAERDGKGGKQVSSRATVSPTRIAKKKFKVHLCVGFLAIVPFVRFEMTTKHREEKEPTNGGYFGLI